MKIKLLLLTCLTVFISLFARANNTQGNVEETIKKSDVAGGVYDSDTKKTLSNVNITAYLASKKEKVVLTGNNGAYAFDELQTGTYKFVFEKDG